MATAGMVLRFVALLAIIAILQAGCSREPLAPRETFHWSERAISFQPPGEGWYHEGELNGGIRGVRFVKKNDRGQAITVGEIHRVAERDRSAAIEKLLAQIDGSIDRDVVREMQLAGARTDSLYSEQESRIAAEVNDALSRAQDAYLNGDPKMARAEVENGLAAARKLRLTVDGVAERAILEPLRQRAGQHFHAIQRKRTQLGARDALLFEWTMELDGRTYHRREVYVMHENHLFTLHFMGLPEMTELFDRVAASVEFPG